MKNLLLIAMIKVVFGAFAAAGPQRDSRWGPAYLLIMCAPSEFTYSEIILCQVSRSIGIGHNTRAAGVHNPGYIALRIPDIEILGAIVIYGQWAS